MERQEFDRLEIEANGHTPTHILGMEKAQRVAILMRIRTKEELSELEKGQNFGV